MKKDNKKIPSVNTYILKNIDSSTIKKAIKNNYDFSKLLNSNKGYIEKIILKYVKRNDDSFDDLYQIGCIALFRALKKFDAKRINASKFHTFAWTVIKNDVLLEVKRMNSVNKSETSIENFHHKKDGDNNSEYKESSWLNMPTYNLEENIVNKISREQYLNTFSEFEKKIIVYRMQNMKMKDIAKITGKNIHLIKNIYYKAIKRENFKEVMANI